MNLFIPYQFQINDDQTLKRVDPMDKRQQQAIMVVIEVQRIDAVNRPDPVRPDSSGNGRSNGYGPLSRSVPENSSSRMAICSALSALFRRITSILSIKRREW